MINQSFLSRLQESIGVLLDVAKAELARSSEDESKFNLVLYSDTQSLERILKSLAPHSDLFSITLSYEIQQGQGEVLLSPKGLLIERWTEDPDLSPPDLNPEASMIFAGLVQQLGQINRHIEISDFLQNLDRLVHAGGSVRVSVNVFLDKADLMQKLEWAQGVRGILYIVVEKFLDKVHNTDIPALGNLLVPGSENTLIVMLGNVSGVGKGPNIRVYGRDHWNSLGDFGFQAKEEDSQKIREAISFRSEEGHWEIPASGLTPFHLCLETDENSLDRANIPETISRLRDRLSVAYLSDRVQANGQSLTCEFKGYKHIQITIPLLKDHASSLPVFKLFAWAYENSSSDKLGIVRQIISLQLGDNADDNYSILCTRAVDILRTAHGNFQFFLRRNVELYFDKRLKVSEFLQKFSEEVGTSVSNVTSELIGNLYKTVGVILGAVIAALIDPKQIPPVVFLTSLLYLVYIIFILIYLLPSSYLRFRGKVKDYHHSVSGLTDVLTEEEIKKLQGVSLRREQWTFLGFFAATNVVYASLGAVAYLLMGFFRSLF